MKYFLFFLLVLFYFTAKSQTTNNGIIIGNVFDADNSHAIQAATVIVSRSDSTDFSKSTITAKDGAFIFDMLPFGLYRLKFSATGFSTIILDSINIRADRSDFDLNEIKLTKQTTALEEVVIYAEKPLIENRDGKIIFNAGESALSAGANTTELLKQTPLVNVDADGKIMLKGKDVKILIDDKPVELNASQLQDLLESMPGSMIDKIEVMTTPPAQYANERGGVINIVTKKGRVGLNARINISYGTRGEAGLTGNIGYRKNKFSMNFNAGYGYNEYQGNSHSARQNIYADSINFFNTNSLNNNTTRRPNARLSIDYDFNKNKSLNFTGIYNSNDANSANETEYTNLNRFTDIYKISNRFIRNSTNNHNPNFNLAYTQKGKNAGEVLKLIAGYSFTSSLVGKNFFQQFMNPIAGEIISDSTQMQQTRISANTITARLNYDRPLKKDKLFLNTGGYFTGVRSHNKLNTEFWKKPDMIFIDNPLLSNDFVFIQDIISARLALRYVIEEGLYINAGLNQEHTTTDFRLKDSTGNFRNNYYSTLPFFNVTKKWENEISLTFSYRRSIKRPGLNEMNPSVDYSDPYNTRFGNPYLLPYYAHNFDLSAGRWNRLYNINFSVGYNELTNIYSSLRTLIADGKTEITWQNISGRKEYEASLWGGYTLSAKSKANLSIGYTYNVYNEHDRTVRKFRNGGSVYSTLNGSYQFSDLLDASGSFTFNRFANPQGTVRTALSMNVGVQRKFFKKKFIISFNVIDPFFQQQNRVVTYGSNFNLESFSTTRTKNFRLTLSYLFSKKANKAAKPLKPAK